MRLPPAAQPSSSTRHRSTGGRLHAEQRADGEQPARVRLGERVALVGHLVVAVARRVGERGGAWCGLGYGGAAGYCPTVRAATGQGSGVRSGLHLAAGRVAACIIGRHPDLARDVRSPPRGCSCPAVPPGCCRSSASAWGCSSIALRRRAADRQRPAEGAGRRRRPRRHRRSPRPANLGAKRGATAELTLTGTNLADPIGGAAQLPGQGRPSPTDNKNGTDAGEADGEGRTAGRRPDRAAHHPRGDEARRLEPPAVRGGRTAGGRRGRDATARRTRRRSCRRRAS